MADQLLLHAGLTDGLTVRLLDHFVQCWEGFGLSPFGSCLRW